ncbi:MAG: pyridoxamine 5'-phosphate oxidase family protein [Candidatus Omnitrophota bacterium]
MEKLPDDVYNFFHKQHCVIVSTIDPSGRPHSSCKGIVQINKNGQVYLIDLYDGRTFSNLKRNPHLAVTAVDEHRFKGFCLKGKAVLSKANELSAHIITAWENKIVQRITQRVVKNISGDKGHPHHPEFLLPKPKYMIVMQIEEIVDLTPRL